MSDRTEQRRGIARDLWGCAPLRQGLVRSALVANAIKPVGPSKVAMVPSFFASWVTSEAAPVMLATWIARTGLQQRARRRRGERLDAPSVVGLGLSAAAVAGTGVLLSRAIRSEEEFRSALASLVPAAELDERPSAVRLGALLPLLVGNRRRRRTRDVVYTERDAAVPGSARLKLDVYAPLADPASDEKRPAVLQIHGGAWVLGSKNEQGIPLLNHLASCGWVGFNVDYRLSPRAKFPDHLVDCKRALAWIREHAEEYNVDPNFIVVTGGSAGGHLCALVALTQNDPQFQPGFEDADTSVQAAVPFYGVYDFTDRDRNYEPLFVTLLERIVMGESIAAAPDKWSAYSPLDRITEDAPPMMVVHGDVDVLVPVKGARRFVKDLAATSKEPVVYAELHGAQHAFEIFPSIRTINSVEYVERFLNFVHSRYLERTSDPDAAAPVQDDPTLTDLVDV